MLPLTPTTRDEQVFFHFSQLGEGGKGRAVLARPKVARYGEMQGRCRGDVGEM